MTRVGIITQARMTSTRLPGKVLLRSAGRSMLGHQVSRLSALGIPIIIATTTNASDVPIVEEAALLGTSIFRGGEHDVLGRYAGGAQAFDLDVIVRVTSDCPLVDPALIKRGLDLFHSLDDPNAHVSNVIERTYPRGLDFEVFSTSALLDAHKNATESSEREHVTPYLYKNRSGVATVHSVRRHADASRYRVTLDTEADFELIRRLLEQHGAAELDGEGIIDVLRAHPSLVDLNAHIEQKKLGQ